MGIVYFRQFTNTVWQSNCNINAMYAHTYRAFVKSAQGIFMSLTDRAYEIVADVFEHFESDVLLQLRDEWPSAYEQALVIQQEEDPDTPMDDEDTPNLSIVCEQIAVDDQEAFLESLQRIIDKLSGEDAARPS